MRERNLRWLYLFVLIYFLYLLVRYLLDQEYFNPVFYGINLGIHEAGHYIIFPLFGEFISMLGGSLFEVLAPIIAMLSFYFHRQYFAVAFCFGWLATALIDTSIYIRDAQEMNLQLLFGQHDWNYILGSLGLLQHDNNIANIVYIFGMLSLSICITYGFYIVSKMFTAEKS
jgi:hypothetical protein